MDPTKAIVPETAENSEDIELQFAKLAVDHAETYWKVLEKIPGSKLRLTSKDDEILEHLYTDFKDFDPRGFEPATTIDENVMKGKVGKEKWRNFIMQYETKIAQYNFGTLLRKSPKVGYENDDTILVLRMQFYAIEIARNKLGLNDWIYEKAQKEQAASK